MAFFVFLYLLEGDAQTLGKLRLAEPHQGTPDADILSDDDVDGFFLHVASRKSKSAKLPKLLYGILKFGLHQPKRHGAGS